MWWMKQYWREIHDIWYTSGGAGQGGNIQRYYVAIDGPAAGRQHSGRRDNKRYSYVVCVIVWFASRGYQNTQLKAVGMMHCCCHWALVIHPSAEKSATPFLSVAYFSLSCSMLECAKLMALWMPSFCNPVFHSPASQLSRWTTFVCCVCSCPVWVFIYSALCLFYVAVKQRVILLETEYIKYYVEVLIYFNWYKTIWATL